MIERWVVRKDAEWLSIIDSGRGPRPEWVDHLQDAATFVERPPRAWLETFTGDDDDVEIVHITIH